LFVYVCVSVWVMSYYCADSFELTKIDFYFIKLHFSETHQIMYMDDKT